MAVMEVSARSSSHLHTLAGSFSPKLFQGQNHVVPSTLTTAPSGNVLIHQHPSPIDGWTRESVGSFTVGSAPSRMHETLQVDSCTDNLADLQQQLNNPLPRCISFYPTNMVSIFSAT